MISASPRDSGQTEPACEKPLVHVAAADIFVAGLKCNHRTQFARIGHGAAQHQRVGKRPAAIGEGNRTGFLQHADLGHFLAVEALGQGCGGMHIDERLVACRLFTYSTSAMSSITGSVSGMTMMLVTPPAAAARDADLMVSRCSAPGSPTKTRASTRPGTADTLAVAHRRTVGRTLIVSVFS